MSERSSAVLEAKQPYSDLATKKPKKFPYLDRLGSDPIQAVFFCEQTAAKTAVIEEDLENDVSVTHLF